MSEPTAFGGFPEAGLHYLRELEENNNKEWFEANRATYETQLVAPAQDFVAALGSRLQALEPAVIVDTSTNGRGVLMRFYRDTRFSKDKSPYKTRIAGIFTDGRGKKMARPGFGFQMGPESMELMAGIFQFTKPQLAAYRAAVADEGSGAELADALREMGNYQLVGEHYKRVPAGYGADHPRADLLRYAGLYVHPAPLDAQYVTSPALVEMCFDHFRRMAPVYEWLQAYVADQ